MNRLVYSIFLLSCLSAQSQIVINGATLNGATISISGVTAPGLDIPIDLLFQWNGVNNTLLTTNVAIASEIGSDKGVISYKDGTVIASTIVTNDAYTAPLPFSVGGVLYSNFNQSILFDLGNSVNYEGISWVPSGTHSNLSASFVFTPNVGGVSANYDVVDIAGGTYSVAEFIMPDTTGYFVAHGQVGASTTKAGASDRLVNGVRYQVTLRHNVTDQQAEVFIVNADTGAFVGYGRTNSDNSTVNYVLLQDYLWGAGALGNYKVQYLALDWTHAAIPLGQTPTIPVVTNLSLNEVSSSEVDIGWNGPPSDFILERDAGSGYVVLTTNANRGPITFIDTTVSAGNTYSYRVTAKAASVLSASTNASISVINQAWHDNIVLANTDSDYLSGDANGQEATTNILSSSGTCTKLRVWSAQKSITLNHVKLALYASDGTLIASSSPVDATGTLDAGWIEASIAPTSVSANTVYLIGFANDLDGGQSWRYDSTKGSSYFQFDTYANFPPNPFPTGSHVNLTFLAGMLTQ